MEPPIKKDQTLDQKKVFNKTNVIFLFLLILSLLASIVFLSLHRGIEQKKVQIFNKTDQINAEYLNRKSLNKTIENLEFAYDAHTYLSSLYVDKANVLDFIVFLENVATISNVNVTIDSIKESAPADPNNFGVNYVDIDIALKATGHWTEIKKYIVTMENLPKYVYIKNLKIEQIDNANNFRVDINLKTVAK